MSRIRTAAAATAVLLFATPMAQASPFEFAGFYAGAHAGYMHSSADFSGGGSKLKDGGSMGGLQAGYNIINGNIMFGVETDVSLTGAKLAAADESVNRLLYATPELTEAVHFSGMSRLTIRLASSKPAANLSVWLVSLPWTDSRSINDNIITRGWADPQNHDSLTTSESLIPGQYYELSFDLQPDDQIVRAGQRIGLMIFSSDRDFTLWPEPGTELTVSRSQVSSTVRPRRGPG